MEVTRHPQLLLRKLVQVPKVRLPALPREPETCGLRTGSPDVFLRDHSGSFKLGAVVCVEALERGFAWQ